MEEKEMPDLDETDGVLLVRIAREAIARELGLPSTKDSKVPLLRPEIANKCCGVFVTLQNLAKGELRGCVGFPEPVFPLLEAVGKAALEAAFHDPRFPPLSKDEINDVKIEVSVLTPPRKLEAKTPLEYPKIVEVGRHGIILKWPFGSGLLLPQVATEYNLSPEDFLCQACLKAGALPDCWLLKETQIFVFEAIVFEEVSPNGSVRRKFLLKARGDK
jgi:uncharacterized protein (TIGR00296 family)